MQTKTGLSYVKQGHKIARSKQLSILPYFSSIKQKALKTHLLRPNDVFKCFFARYPVAAINNLVILTKAYGRCPKRCRW